LINRIFLELCMGMEGLCADLYRYYGSQFEANPEAAQLWKKAAMQKENQQWLYEMALRLLGEMEFRVSRDSLAMASRIQFRLLGFIADCGSETPDLVTAVAKAVELEEELACLHAQASMHFRDRSLGRLFSALNDAGRLHVDELQRFRETGVASRMDNRRVEEQSRG